MIFFLFHCAQQTYQRSLYQALTDKSDINIKNHIFRILHSKCITIIISICHFDHRIYKLTTVIKRTCILKGKGVIFVKLHPKSANDRDTSDCNNTGSLEACIWKNRANLPVFAEFLLSYSPLSKRDTSYSTNTSLNFSQPFFLPFWWVSVFLGLNPLGPLDLDRSK